MWLHYTKLFVRNFLKNKGISLQRLINLVIGFSVAFMTFLYVDYETNFEKHFSKHDDIYRVQHNSRGSLWAATPLGLGEYLATNFSDVDKVVRVDPAQTTIRKEDLVFVEENILFVDTTFFDVFDYRVNTENAASVLLNPNGVVITESMAAKYFGDQNPVGEFLTFDFDRGESRVVSGVMEDPSAQSHLQFGFLIPITVFGKENLGRWRNWATYTYALMNEGFQSNPTLKEEITSEYLRQYRIPEEQRDQLTIHFVPLRDIHLKSDAEKELAMNSNIDYVLILGAASFLVLLISFINFLNLGFVASFSKLKEAGIRKAIGAESGQIYSQFVFESFLYVGISLVLAVGASFLLLPFFKNFSGLDLNLLQFQNSKVILSIGIITMLIGWVGGGFPASRLSRVKLELLRAKTLPGRSSTSVGMMRNVLITLQLVISIGLISGSVVIYRQLQFIENQELGFESEQILVMPITNEMGQQFESLKSEWKGVSSVLDVSSSSSVPGYRIMREGITNLQTGDVQETRLLLADADFINTYQIQLDSGRMFQESSPIRKEVILNRKAATLLFENQPVVGRYVVWGRDTAEVVGIAENFMYESLHESVMPLTIWLNPSARFASIRFEATQVHQVVSQIEKKYKEVLPASPPLEAEFLSSRFEFLYLAESRLKSLVWIFCAISILLTATGVFGIASFTTQQRTKEIAVRKVLGGSVANMIGLVSRPFIIIAVCASVIAFPLSYKLIDWWLQDFAFRVETGLGLIILSLLSIFVVLILSTGFVSYKAAKANPVKNLQGE